jgi:hypothetical protein
MDIYQETYEQIKKKVTINVTVIVRIYMDYLFLSQEIVST